jgi:hypothetical protein
MLRGSFWIRQTNMQVPQISQIEFLAEQAD